MADYQQKNKNYLEVNQLESNIKNYVKETSNLLATKKTIHYESVN